MVVTAEKHMLSVEGTIVEEIRVRVRELDCFATAFLSMVLDASLNSEPLFPSFYDERIG